MLYLALSQDFGNGVEYKKMSEYLRFREIDKVEKRSKILFSKQFSTVTNFMEKEACELGRNRWKSKCSQITYTRKKMKKKMGVYVQ